MATPNPDSRKRQRTSSNVDAGRSNSADPANITQHKDFYFSDGNLVLIAELTAFRVHGGILSRHSEVFRDMFIVSWANSTEEQYDGCSAVNLTETYKDLEFLLTLLYDGCKMGTGRVVVLPFWKVSAMLRLGTKYQIEPIRLEAIARLKTCFPSSLAAFDLSAADDQDSESTNDDNDRQRTPFRLMTLDDPSQNMEVVGLARTFNLESLLPTAFYTCSSTLDFDVLVTGAQKGLFSFEDLALCLKGKEWLLKQNMELLMPLVLCQLSPICTGEGFCEEHFRNLVDDKREWLCAHDPLCNSRDWLEGCS